MMHWGSRHLRALSLTLLVVASVAVSTTPVETVDAFNAPWTTPTVPPRCSSEQANSGNVAGCLLSSNPGQPDSRGWPTPPFPGEAGGGFPGTGWFFNGASYNGSAALAGWEAAFVTNPNQIGSVRPGQLSSQADALPLFIGFLAEIQAGGYRVFNGTGAYSFRCTASTRKDCRGLTRSSLSNHAFGLATDLNTSQNPMQTQYGINGASACQTPMKTDMPQWIIQVAEKWGLYWGGYGWSRGCSSPAEFKTSASRDPMHFEFNGTVAQAQAILCFNLGNTPKFEVVAANGNIEKRCFGPNVPPADTRMVIHTNAPEGAVSALVNLTGVSSTEQGYFTAEPCYFSQNYQHSNWSNGNIRPGRAVAGTAVVALDSLGRFCLYRSTGMHSIVDVLGFFAPEESAPDGSLFTPVGPVRITDSRNWPYCTPEWTCAGVGTIPAMTEVQHSTVSAVAAADTVANITSVLPMAAGFLTADDCASLPANSPHSNVNFAAGDVVANLVLSPSESTVDGSRFCTYSRTAMHTLVDVQGFFAPATEGGLGYRSMQPVRLIDTRQCWTDLQTEVERCALLNAAGSIVKLRSPPESSAAVINITTTSAPRAGYVSAGPCSVITGGTPSFSNVNAVVGAAVANAAIVPVDVDGTFCLYISDPMHVLVDLMGTFTDSGGDRFLSVTPQRVHDSRTLG